MKRTIRYWIEGEGRNAFHKALPDELKAFVIERTDYQNVFRVPHEQIDKLRNIDARARAAGFKPYWYAELDASGDPIEDARMYVLAAPVLEGAEFNYGWLSRSTPCKSCGRERVEAAVNDIEPKLRLESESTRRLFSVADGAARIIDADWADALKKQGLMSGAVLRAVEVSGSARRYYLLTAQHDLGPLVWEPSDPCPTCGAERTGGGYFPLLRRPDARTDVAFTSQYGPFTPLVSGRLGRELVTEAGVGLELMGWFPDDLELARIPTI